MRILVSSFLFLATFSGTALAGPESNNTYLIDDTHYISSHPTGGCNEVIRRITTNVNTNKKNIKYLFSRTCGGRQSASAWEQEFVNVKEVKGSSVIYIPEQKMVDGRTFPANYWCKLQSTREFLRTWRAAYCTKYGLKGAVKY